MVDIFLHFSKTSTVSQFSRADGFRVVERARPRSRRAVGSLGGNHGGVNV